MATAPSTLNFPANFPAPDGAGMSHLGQSVRIEGKIFSNQDLQVDGEVEGTLEVSGHNLTFGANARVKADVKAQNVSVVGTVEGTIEATDRTELCSQCRVVGNIITRRIAIKDGAFFKGEIEVIQQRSVVAIRPTGEDSAEPS